jgi:hypothetical protein
MKVPSTADLLLASHYIPYPPFGNLAAEFLYTVLSATDQQRSAARVVSVGLVAGDLFTIAVDEAVSLRMIMHASPMVP